MNEVKALILEAIERLNDENTQEAFKAQYELSKAIESLEAERVLILLSA